MLGPRRRMRGRCFCDEGIAAADSPWLRCLRASGLACLKERLTPAGVFLEISWRCRKSADVMDLGGAYGCSGSAAGADNTRPAADRSFSNRSSAHPIAMWSAFGHVGVIRQGHDEARAIGKSPLPIVYRCKKTQ